MQFLPTHGGGKGLFMNVIYPSTETQSGWKILQNEYEMRTIGGMEPHLVELFYKRHLNTFGGWDWGITVIRHGAIVEEFFCPFGVPGTTYSTWSCTKSFTSVAWGMLFEDSKNGLLPGGVKVGPESFAYDYIPQGFPLSDERKKNIKIKHLLSMTSGLAGEMTKGIYGCPTDYKSGGPFELILGKCTSRKGIAVDKLTAEPATVWDYSDVGFMHLAIMFHNITGRQMSDYIRERIFEPIGIESAHWDMSGGGKFLGPYPNVDGGLQMSVRDLARFGYLLLQKGKWEEKQIIPKDWIELATKTSQRLNPDYGYGFWTNEAGTLWPYLPKDAFALMGHCCSKCYVIPSLDLVVARLGTGPNNWFEYYLIGGIMETIIT